MVTEGRHSRLRLFRELALCLVVVALVTVWCRVALPDESPGQLEYRVKAAFLLNFTKFVESPTSQSATRDPRLVICIVGDDPFGPALDRMVAGESVGGRQIVVERVREQSQSGCSVAFFSKSEKDVAKSLSAFGPGVLTVGEGDSFLEEGGMISFVIDNRRVRFDINQKAALSAGLKLSSRLLTVARSVQK